MMLDYMTPKFLVGDTVKDTCGDDITLIHRTEDGFLIGLTRHGDPRRYYPNGEGFNYLSADLVPPKSMHDQTLEIWLTLDVDLRAIILAAAQQKKIITIKYLRGLTGLGLTAAKYAVETFTS